ncbi:hypothetical protein LEP1GSC017_1193 [Leptospira meyeri serovar Hardjo str. Went 5]|nr:hypothetical protein LEP1GSC017_1193 [Leptospira meyeri serovar Hardjo str. Went 5]
MIFNHANRWNGFPDSLHAMEYIYKGKSSNLQCKEILY